MSLIIVMGNAALSRVCGGVMFDHQREPIKKEDLKTHLEKIKSGSGLSVYYHLDEEQGILTRYDKRKDYAYFPVNSRILTTHELQKMSLAYEILKGFDPNKHRFRKKWVSSILGNYGVYNT